MAKQIIIYWPLMRFELGQLTLKPIVLALSGLPFWNFVEKQVFNVVYFFNVYQHCESVYLSLEICKLQNHDLTKYMIPNKTFYNVFIFFI